MTCDVQTSAEAGGLRGRMRLEALLTRAPGGRPGGAQTVHTGCDDALSVNTNGDC